MSQSGLKHVSHIYAANHHAKCNSYLGKQHIAQAFIRRKVTSQLLPKPTGTKLFQYTSAHRCPQYLFPHQIKLSLKIQDFVTTFFNEEKEKERRHLNEHYYSQCTSTSEDGQTRKHHDIDFVDKMCQTKFNTKVSVLKAFRLKKKGTKPRLLKISPSTNSEKANIFKSLEIRPHIFITPDLTPKEQQRNKQLRSKLTKRA